MPQGLGEHSLHFRTINLKLFTLNALLVLERSLGTVILDFGCGYHVKWLRTLDTGGMEFKLKKKD